MYLARRNCAFSPDDNAIHYYTTDHPRQHVVLSLYLTYRNWWVILLTIWCFSIIIQALVERFNHATDLTWIMLAIVIICIIPLRIIWNSIRLYKKHPSLQRPISYHFHEVGYNIISGENETNVHWNDVIYRIPIGRFLVLKARNKSDAILNTSYLSGEQRNFITGMFDHRQLPHLAPGTTYQNARNGRHLYPFGWFGLFPVAGAVAGVILLYKAIHQYKNKILGIIGVAAMLPTVLLFGLPLAFKHIPAMSAGFQVNASMDLTKTVRAIEFYRLQYGEYPDSLQALLQTDNLAPVYDPLQMSRESDNILFQYHRYGDKYTVYSRGLDGLAGTDDDLYPQVKFTDSTRIGLIRRK